MLFSLFSENRVVFDLVQCVGSFMMKSESTQESVIEGH